MIRYFSWTAFLMSVLLFSCHAPSTTTLPTSLQKEIDAYLTATQELHEVPGMAIAIIQEGEVIYQNCLGVAYLETQEPLHAHHMLRVYSSTKLLTSTAIFQLIEQGKIALNDPITKYLDDLPDEWSQVHIGDMLAHGSGLPNMVRYPDTLDQAMIKRLIAEGFEFETGARFSYNQTNYWFLARIIEKVTGSTFAEFLIANQFPQGTSEVLLSSNSQIEIPHRISKYEYDDSKAQFVPTRYAAGVKGHAANGLNISLTAFIDWAQRFRENDMISAQTQKQMWTRYPFKNEEDAFLYGWGIYPANERESYGFTGGGVSGFRIFPNQDLTIIYLSSGSRYVSIHNYVIDHLASIVDSTAQNAGQLAEESLIQSFLQDSIDQALTTFQQYKQQLPEHNFENILNSLGYALRRSGRLQDAIRIFQVNVETYPNSSNVYDSLGEAYLADEQLALALVNYRKALERNPGNPYVQGMIKQIEEKMGT
ncbi:MAG: serine hydrolase [Bacteroidota bacterium]